MKRLNYKWKEKYHSRICLYVYWRAGYRSAIIQMKVKTNLHPLPLCKNNNPVFYSVIMQGET